MPESSPIVNAPSRRRWRFRLSLRVLMISVIVIGVPLGWVARRAAIQRRAVLTVRAAGGTLTYSDQIDAAGNSLPKIHEQGAPAWLRRVVGDEPFETVVAVWFDARRGPIRLDEATMDAVATFDHLQTFFVNGPSVAPGTPLDRPLAAANLARLSGLTRLQKFRLFEIAVDPAVIDLLPNWPSLEGVTVASEEPCLPGSSLRPLGRLPRLKSVVISALKSSTSDDLAPLLALPQLTTLIIGRGPKSDAGLERFARQPGLTTLQLLGTEIGESTLAALASNPTLEALSFDATKLPPGGLRHLAGATHLRSLSVMLDGRSGLPGWPPSHHRAVARFGDADLDALRAVPLGALGMMGLDATDAGIARLLATHRLATLPLSGRGVTDASVPTLLGEKPLFYLTLTGTSLTDAGLLQLASHPDLHTLTLLDNASLTDQGIAALATCPKLKQLTIRQPGVTPTALDALRLAKSRSGGLTITVVPAEAP